MNKKGFTLVELMTVVFFLGLLVLIALPNITGLLVQTKEMEYNNFLSTIYLATEAYVQKSRSSELELPGDSICVSVNDLIKSKYLKTTTYNPKTKEAITSELTYQVKVTLLEDKTYNYDYQTTCSGNSVVREVIIDGKKTNTSEWLTKDIAYITDTDVVYVRSDDTYLYLYATTDVDIASANIQMYISTTEATLLEDYNFAIENGRLYNYSNGFGDKITEEEHSESEGIEYKILLADLNIFSVDELRGISLKYMDSDWNQQKYITVILGDPGTVADGKMTYENEYTESDLFYQDTTTTVYTKIDSEYLYVYALVTDINISDVPNVSIYIGSNDTSKTSSSQGFTVWCETDIRSCDSNGCTSSANVISGAVFSRAIADGVEFKIPTSTIGISSISDIRNVRLLFRDSNWSEIKTTDIAYSENKIKLADLEGKTAIIAKKPSDWFWKEMYIYIYGETTPTEWNGIKMSNITDAEEKDLFAYILPDDMTYAYAIFNIDNGSSQCPSSNFDIFRIDKGQTKYWNGTIANNVNNWSNYDGSVSEDTNVYLEFKTPTDQTEAGYAHFWDDGSGLIWDGKTGTDWPGVTLVKDETDGYFKGTIDTTNIQGTLWTILHNNDGYRSDSNNKGNMPLKPGITIRYEEGKWKVMSDK